MPKIGGWPPSGFGGRLRTLREGAGLSQQGLAESAGCHWMTVAKLERGAQEPAWPLVLALAKALGVSCEAFQNGEPAEPRPRGRPPKAAPGVPPAAELEEQAEAGAKAKRPPKPAPAQPAAKRPPRRKEER
jgi:transcriptional regulator with XRE-family HTH domain